MGDRALGARAVTLWNLEGVVAIVLERSGVVYSNQTGGHACLQPAEEGFLIPFNDDPPLDQPEAALWRRLRAPLLNAPRLTSSLADRVDAELATCPDTKCARVDRDRLDDSHEAWVYVDITAAPDGLLRGFGNFKAVLTWPNSD